MHNILYILILIAMAATLITLVRGIIQFLKTTREDLEGDGPNLSGERQNRMMRLRIAFQALAVLLVVLFLLIGGSRS